MDMEQKAAQQQVPPQQAPEKFCKHCGGKIPADAVVCTLCGRQVEQVAQGGAPNIVINNANQNTNSSVNAYVAAKARNKWVALGLCLFLGVFGAHKFYEGKAGLGVLYLLTCGLLGIGVVIDFITILFRPNPYFI
ncbi:TM2 domain-containing protein [Christensenellaceae bacterium 44-20]